LVAGAAEAGARTAQIPACSGEDMIAEFAAREPQTLDEIRTEASAVPNGRGLLWRIEGAGVEPSWLFGTMHMSDPRVLRLPPAAQAAFDASDTVVIETTDVLDETAIAA